MTKQQRYDLVINNDLGDSVDKLVLYRFPALQSQFENPPETIKLSIKPKSLSTKLEVTLDKASKDFCRETAASIAQKSTSKSFQDDMVDRNVYTSTRVQVDDGQLFVAKIVNNKIVCRPITDFLFLRSDFSHLDVREEIVDPNQEVKPVSVKFAALDRQNNPTKSAANLAAQQQAAADDSGDDYHQMAYKSILSNESKSQREALFGKPMPKVKPDPDEETKDVKPKIHAMDIKPKIEKLDGGDIYSSEHKGPALLSGSKNSNFIKEKVKDCLRKAKLVSFEEIHQFIKGYGQNFDGNIQLNNKDILDCLSDVALLVQGNWAIKSEILYGDSSERESTDVTGIPINTFLPARDYLLSLFTESRLVSRLEYSKKVRIPDHDVLELFNQLAIFKPEIRKWEFKLPTDSKFLKHYPEVVARQKQFWRVKKSSVKLSQFY